MGHSGHCYLCQSIKPIQYISVEQVVPTFFPSFPIYFSQELSDPHFQYFSFYTWETILHQQQNIYKTLENQTGGTVGLTHKVIFKLGWRNQSDTRKTTTGKTASLISLWQKMNCLFQSDLKMKLWRWTVMRWMTLQSFGHFFCWCDFTLDLLFLPHLTCRMCRGREVLKPLLITCKLLTSTSRRDCDVYLVTLYSTRNV